ncbi:unnamed protein product [Leptidea sinapis]|uniref:Uncharacterized protein n=1 Tax=Leptidea sinapis TaxID=189913 RepID=A0A5E4QM88_9NEOP|nr:unnamed protein product [Leptidea sinapis]
MEAIHSVLMLITVEYSSYGINSLEHLKLKRKTFYNRYIVQKFKDQKTLAHKFHAVFNYPSWKAGGYVRFQDMPEDPAIHTRVKYDVILPKWCSAYLICHYALVLVGFIQLFHNHLYWFWSCTSSVH